MSHVWNPGRERELRLNDALFGRPPEPPAWLARGAGCHLARLVGIFAEAPCYQDDISSASPVVAAARTAEMRRRATAHPVTGRVQR